MKRIITLLIAFLLLLSLTACAEEKQDPDTTTAAGDSSTTAAEVDSLSPEESFELPAESTEYAGKFIIYNGFSDATTLFTTCTMVSEDGVSGDALDAAIYRRCLTMEEKYGVEVCEVPIAASQQYDAVEKDAWELTFPAAFAVLGSRPYEYEVVAHGAGGKTEAFHVMANGYNHAPGHPRAKGASSCCVSADRLPPGTTHFTVTPLDCWWNKGAALTVKMPV